jgi:hypothetical protein
MDKIKNAITALLLTAILVVASSIPNMAQAVGGGKSGAFRLPAMSYKTFEVRFRKGHAARIVLKGDGDTDLDLLVFDENGNKVASDEDNTDTCVVEWTPRWTGKFIIKVVNHGTVYNDFAIATN